MVIILVYLKYEEMKSELFIDNTVFAGCVVFSVLGFMASEKDVPIDKVAIGGGL